MRGHSIYCQKIRGGIHEDACFSSWVLIGPASGMGAAFAGTVYTANKIFNTVSVIDTGTGATETISSPRRTSHPQNTPTHQALLALSIRWPVHTKYPAEFLLTPSLKATMYRFVVRIRLREHMPLGSRIKDPKHGFQDTAGGNRFAPRSPVGNILLREMLADFLPLRICQGKGHVELYPYAMRLSTKF